MSSLFIMVIVENHFLNPVEEQPLLKQKSTLHRLVKSLECFPNFKVLIVPF